MYHRQIFKVLLSNRVLENPKQRRLFHTFDLTELFNLNESADGRCSESDRLFESSKLLPTKPASFSADKIEEMRKLAAALSNEVQGNARDATSTSAEALPERRSSGAVKSRKKHKKSRDEATSAIFEGERVSCLIGRRLGRSRTEQDSFADDHYVFSA